MTIAETLRQQGIQKGLEQGILVGEAAVLQRLLERRFGALTENYLIHLQQASAEELLSCCDRVLDAKTLEEVFKSH